MAHDLTEALGIQHQVVGLAEAIRDNGFDRSYLTPDGRGYVLAVHGDGAKSMDDFIKAVGQYLIKMQRRRGGREAAKSELLQAFDQWLSTQKIRDSSD